jgi:N-acetylmuramoyl-L-alanine amidase
MPKIAIDAGHGLYTAGKRCMKKLDSNETREWFLNDRIADKLEQMLKAYNCEVLRTDDTTGAMDVPLATRAAKANSWKADIFISIHHNAGVAGGKGGGTIVFHYGNTERAAQAKALYKAIVNETGLKGNRATTVDKVDYYVLANTKMAAFLIENGFMDSSTDVPIILSAAHAEKTAQGILKFLIDYFKLSKKQTISSGSTLCKVQTGAFKSQPNAANLKTKLNKAGFDAVIVKVGALYKVQCGAFKNRENAENLKARLRAAGFEAVLLNE